jgi:SAM-dependent methyltransferase
MRRWLEGMRRKSALGWAFATTLELTLEAVAAVSVLAASLLLVYFPYSRDMPPSPAETDKTRSFYATVYDRPDAAQTRPEDAVSKGYEAYARWEIRNYRVKETVGAFVQRFHLQTAKALDVGSGSGYLQDVVEDYTGLDISTSARRFYHKPFVAGSATAMPFSDNTFDTIWTIWVLEHVPNPEQALREIRRVAKDGGLLFLAPAWDVPSWAAQGYDYRPYSDFGAAGRLVKASLPVRRSFQEMAKTIVWPVRLSSWELTGGPTSFRYRRLEPNYATYLSPDADAVNSLDRNETALWFASRGDECLNCASIHSVPDDRLADLIIRVHKGS